MLAGESDAGEMSLATFVQARSAGAALIAMPIVTGSRFLEPGIGVRPGADIIKGSDAQDRLYGDGGKDEVWGFGTGDFIHLDDGAPGDKGYGGAGVDLAYTDSGDSWQEN